MSILSRVATESNPLKAQPRAAVHSSGGTDVLPAGDAVIRTMSMPAELNPNGHIFGGWIMAQADVAAGITAMRRAQGRVTTVAVNSYQFIHPVSLGDLLSFYGTVESVGTTSIKVRVEIYAESIFSDFSVRRVADSLFTFVAIDDDGNKRPVPSV